MKSIKHILPFLKEHKYRYIMGILILIIIDALQLITPRVIGNLTDDLMNGLASVTALYRYMGIIMGIAILVASGRFAWRMLIIGASREMEAWLRLRLFSHIETLPAEFFSTNKTGDIMALSTNDINSVRMAFGHGIVMVTDAIFLTIMTLGIMTTQLSLKLTLLAVLPMPIIALSVSFMGIRIKNKFKRVQEAFGTLTDKTQESFSGIRIVKSFVQEESELDSFRLFNEDNYKANMSLIRIWGLMHPLVSFISALSLILALSYGSKLVINAQLTLGEFVAFITYLSKLTWPMMAIGWLVNMMQRGFVSLTRISEILEKTPAYPEENPFDKNAPLPELTNNIPSQNIVFDKVSFTYQGAQFPALDNITFTLEGGQTLAIIGRTGAGKTTLTNLLLRVYDNYSGTIRIGPHSIKDYTVSQMRQMIGFVPQDNFLFSKSVEENILFSGVKADPDTVSDFARLAQLHNEVSDFPDGYATMLGEKGVNLSGGQKQRLSIARALIKDSPILIFDDALSAVDTNTESKLLDGIKAQTKNKTTIIIAHRISTVKHADHIIVLDEGKMIESGNHTQLVESGGFYAHMYSKQMLEERIMKEG